MTKPALRALEYRNQIRSASIEAQNNNQDKIKLLLRYGTLAPSTHNTQPWRLDLLEDEVRVLIDFSKSVPVADPTTRDMYLSLGALVKNIQLAAQEFGVNAEIKLADQLKKNENVLTISFTNLNEAKDPQSSEILDGIVRRQNYRGFFEKQFDSNQFSEICDDVFGEQQKVKVNIVRSKERIEKLAKLTAKGLRMGYAMPSFRKEISSYINHNMSRRSYGLHGYSLRLSGFQSWLIPKIMRTKDIGSKLADLNYKSFILSPVVMILATEKDEERSWLDTGLAMEEAMVKLAAAGLTCSIYTAAVEMPGLRDELAKTAEIKDGTLPQVLFCVGEPGTALPFSVRKSLEHVTR